jgi:membrane protein YdbS with pleckstrin-like domain
MNGLHSRIRLRWGLLALVGVVVFAAIVTAAERAFLEAWPLLGPVVGVALLPLVAAYVQLLYGSWRYGLDEDALELERGVFTKVDTAVPYVRIQHVDTQRDPLDRTLGLGKVVVYTAGSRGADVSVPGLTTEEARDLRNRLRDLAIESEPEDAV